MTRVFVTGASGFVGRRVVRALRERGHDVLEDRVELFDDSAVRSYLGSRRPDVLLHLAWVTQPPLFWQSEENARWRDASLYLIQCFADAGGRAVVGAGSCAEYEWTSTACVEDVTRLAGTTLYAQCKNAARAEAAAACRNRGVRFAWGRVFFVYGAGEHPKKFISSLFADMRAGSDITLREPMRRLDYVHVNDVAQAFVRLVDSDADGNFNIGTGTGAIVRDIAATAAAITGYPKEILSTGEAVDASDVIADTEKMRRLGWAPGVPLETGMQAMYEAGAGKTA